MTALGRLLAADALTGLPSGGLAGRALAVASDEAMAVAATGSDLGRCRRW